MAVKMSPKFVVLCSLAVGAIYTTGYSVSSSQGNSPLGAAQTTAQGATASSQGGSGQGASGDANPSNSNASENTSQGNATASASNTSTTQSSGAQSGNAASSSKSAAKSASQSTSGPSTKSASTTTAKSTTSSTKSSSTTTKTATSTSKTTSSSTAKTATPPVQYRYLNGTYTGSGSNRIGTVEVAVSVHSGKITAVQITGCYTHYPQYYIDPVLPNYVVSHQTTQIPYVSGATLSSDDFYNAVVEALSKAHNPNYKG